MANNNQIYKFSNAGGFKSLNRYHDMLAGNNVWNPWEPDGAYDALATVTVPSGGLASVTFAAIPNTYKHLQVRFFADLDTADRVLRMRINGVSSTGTYAKHGLEGNGSTASAYGVNSTSATWLDVGYVVSAGHNPAVAVIDILDYANTSKNKTTRTLAGNDQNGAGLVGLYSGLYISNSEITSVEFSIQGSGNFAQHSQFSLYGIR